MKTKPEPNGEKKQSKAYNVEQKKKSVKEKAGANDQHKNVVKTVK